MPHLRRRLLLCIATLILSLGLSAPSRRTDSAGWFAAAHADPVAITELNASAVATDGITAAGVHPLIPFALGGSRSGMGKGGLLPSLSQSSPNTTALAAAFDVMLFNAESHPSPMGGRLDISKDQTGKLDATFVGLRTLHGMLKGDISVRVTAGNVVSGTYTARVKFKAFTFVTPDATLRFDGPATLDVTSNATSCDVTWTASYRLDTPQGAVTCRDLSVHYRLSYVNRQVSGTTTLSGSLDVRGVHGVTGTLNVATPSPLTYTTALSASGAGPLSITAGTVTLNDTLALTMVRPNIVRASLAGKTLKLFTWAYLGGQTLAGYALRPTVADVIFYDGNILTVDDKNPRAQALAVRDARILAVGSTNVVFPYQSPATRMIDLNGKTLMPGFVEPHAHTNLSALNLLADVNPQVVRCGDEQLGNSVETVLARLRAAVRTTPNAAAIYGFGFDPSRLVKPELMRNLTLQELDAVSPTVPIVVQNASQHVSYVNSAAFRATGIWPSAPNGPYTPPAKGSPLDGFIPADPKTGLPTGVLNDFGQTPFIKLAVGSLLATKAQKIAYAKQWRAFQNILAQAGITTYADMLVGGFAGPDIEGELFEALALDPTNPCRVRGYLSAQDTDPKALDIFPGEGYDRVRMIGAKIVADGSTQGLTAGLSFDYKYPGPYPAAPNGLTEFKTSDDFYATALPWHRAGWQIATHSNGDRTLDLVLAGLAKLQKTVPNKDARFRIEHYTVHTPAELQRQVAAVKALNAVVGFTIGHVYYWGQVFHDTLLGDANSELLVPMKALFDAGVRVTTHSDSPVTTPNPLRNVYIATSRLWQAPPQQVLGASQIITAPQALKTITINAAWSLFLDKKVGSLEVGKNADLVVLSGDPTAVAPAQLLDIEVLGTWLDGRQVSGARL